MDGIIYWITGLSCAGKTSIGKELYKYIKSNKKNVMFLDGDEYRPILFPHTGYSMEERREAAFRLGLFLQLLSNQGIDAVVCTISMFDDVRKWNRENIKFYKEIYLDVPMNELVKRDKKGLYSRTVDNKEDIVGVTVDAEFPKKPDIRVINDGTKSIKDVVEYIIQELNI